MDSELLSIFVWPILAVMAFFAGVCWLSSQGCHSRWANSGFETSWGPAQGCLISKDGKVFIPEDNYREFKD